MISDALVSQPSYCTARNQLPKLRFTLILGLRSTLRRSLSSSALQLNRQLSLGRPAPHRRSHTSFPLRLCQIDLTHALRVVRPCPVPRALTSSMQLLQ